MAMNEFVPMSWNGEPISTDKLNQMCNNTQYLFDRSPRIRYATNGITRDTGLKVLAGKTSYPTVQANYVYLPVYFGSFFSSGCRPVVVATVEAPFGGHRNRVMVYGFNGVEIDQTGFQAVVTTEAVPTLGPGGWVHWSAVGY